MGIYSKSDILFRKIRFDKIQNKLNKINKIIYTSVNWVFNAIVVLLDDLVDKFNVKLFNLI